MKLLIPFEANLANHRRLWVVVLSLALAATGCGPSKEQLAKYQQQEQELQKLREETKELEKLRRDNREVQRLRKDNLEILSLRSDHQKYQQLQKDHQKLLGLTQQLSNQIASVQHAYAQESAALRSQNQQLQGAMVQTAERAASLAPACINNLRILEGAKDQWALEHKKPIGSLPRPDEVQPYLRNNRMPPCPAGGTYSLNSVGIPATCSIPGHKL